MTAMLEIDGEITLFGSGHFPDAKSQNDLPVFKTNSGRAELLALE